MDEDPKEHNFDQRHDGPFDQPRPSVQIPRPSTSPAPNAEEENASPIVSPTRKSVQLPHDSTERRGRKSVQIARGDGDPAHTGRKSTQMSRAASRPSRDFDVRRDGPYGRPSLTMVRRRSSGVGGLPSPAGVESDKEGQAAEGETMPTMEEILNPTETAFEPEPPPLNYSLWTRKWSIIFFWSLIVVDCIAMPVGLYFGLWYGTDLSPNIVFSVVTAALGGVSIVEYILRFWRLFRHNSNCRVIGARRMYLDWFHWNFSLGWIVIMIELIVGTVPENPPIRLLAMPVTSMLYVFGTELLVVDFLRYFEVPAPVRISSIPRGTQLRPGIYSVIEDVCAVDGSGGTAFREALNKRYEASHIFRAMLRRLGAFWAFGAELMAVVTTILIFTIQHEAAYVVGWAAPFVWAGVWTLITYFYVNKKLREEKVAWSEEIVEKAATAA